MFAGAHLTAAQARTELASCGCVPEIVNGWYTTLTLPWKARRWISAVGPLESAAGRALEVFVHVEHGSADTGLGHRHAVVGVERHRRKRTLIARIRSRRGRVAVLGEPVDPDSHGYNRDDAGADGRHTGQPTAPCLTCSDRTHPFARGRGSHAACRTRCLPLTAPALAVIAGLDARALPRCRRHTLGHHADLDGSRLRLGRPGIVSPGPLRWPRCLSPPAPGVRRPQRHVEIDQLRSARYVRRKASPSLARRGRAGRIPVSKQTGRRRLERRLR